MEQANTDFFILCELLKDYLGLLGSVRDAFHERTKLFQHWQHAQQMLTRKREIKTKLELNNRTDKIDQAGIEVMEVRFKKCMQSAEIILLGFSGRPKWKGDKRTLIKFRR